MKLFPVWATLRVALAALPVLAACSGTGGGGYRILRTEAGEVIDLEALARATAEADVVFLGEMHDSDTAHELQLALTKRLYELSGDVAISLEMFERDVQPALELYLGGVMDEERFLELSRPWPNYAEHYRPVIELARAEHLDVLAANVPRWLAARVAKEGLGAVIGDAWAAYHVDAGPGEYRERFVEVMGDHADSLAEEDIDRVFAAQCIKDDTMADSIARYIAEHGADAPLVVHWCGRFHSDFGLGTVERLTRRLPHLKVVVVTTQPGGARAGVPDGRVADFVWQVP